MIIESFINGHYTQAINHLKHYQKKNVKIWLKMAIDGDWLYRLNENKIASIN